MKRSMLFMLLVALLALWAIPGFTQTLEYGFTATQGTYTPITGGLSLGTISSDDQRFLDPNDLVGSTVLVGPGLPIGFNFMFNGLTFDRLAINTNGWISLGQSSLTPAVNIASSSAYTPLSTTTAITPDLLINRIAGLARDLQAQAGASIRLETIGTAPNRICVVQWQNYKKYGTTGTDDQLHFQIRLHEGTNAVSIVYGNIVANANQGQMQVGLRGPDATDFNARQGASGWNNTTAASAFNQFVILDNQNTPAAGLTFSFAYPIADSVPNPANAVSPYDGATLLPPTASLNWRSGGGLPEGFKLNLGTNNPPSNIAQNLDLGIATSYTPAPALNIGTTYFWQVVPYNSFGNATNCPVWSFSTHGDTVINNLPYIQHWDAVTAPAMPFDWTTIINSSSTSAYVQTSTSSPHSAPNNVQLSNSADESAELLLVSPEIHQSIAMQSIRVKAWLRPSTATYVLQLGVMSNPTDPASFELLHTYSFANTVYSEYAVALSSYTGSGRYIAFRHGLGGTYRTIYVDEITFEAIAPNDLAATAISGNATPSVGIAANYSIEVMNNGTATQNSYQVKLFNAANTELASVAGPSIAAGISTQVQIPWTPTTVGPNGLYGKVVLAGDVNPVNDQSPILNISVQPEGMASVTIGEGNLTEGIPWEFFYKHSLFQTLYYPNEIGMLGNITGLTFYNNFTTNLVAKPVKIWLGTTNLPDLSAGWIDPSTLLLVYDGTLDFPSGANTIVVPLQVPYNYAGGNLVLYAFRPMDAGYFSSSDDFKAQTVGSNRARKLISDSTVYDPMAPSAAGTLSGTFPKTTLIMSPLSPDPIFIASPSSKNFGDVLLGENPQQVFSMMNAGGGTLSINSISLTGSNFFSLSALPTLPVQLATGQNTTFSVNYAPTAAGAHTATITIVDSRRLSHSIELSANAVDATIYELSYAQNFDSVGIPSLPLGWKHIYQSTATTGYVKTLTSSPHTAPNCVGIYNPTDINTIAMLIAPPLATTIPTNSVRVKLWGKGTGYSLKVGVMSNPADAATFTEVQTLTFTSTWAQYEVSLASYTGTGKYIAFKHANNSAGQTIYVDTIEFEMMGANDLAARAISGNSTPSLNAATNYTVTVFNNGTAPQSTYTVKLYDSSHTELATVAGTATIAAGNTANIAVSWTPTTEGPMSIYGKVILAGDINPGNDNSPLLSLSVQPAGVITVTIGDGTQTDRMPLDFFYNNSVYQNIYYPNEINTVGNITTLSLFNQFTSTTLSNKSVKIWMAITTQEDLNAGWIPSSAMTLVFNGTMNFPAGANTITFPLQAPFAYTGGNLVVMFNRPMDTAYFSSTDYFKTQVGTTGRAREMHSDSTTYDPANLTGGTLTGIFPKTTFTLTPMGGDPVFMVNPGSHNFGDVNIGASRSQNFSIMNVGGGNLGINAISIAGSPAIAISQMPTLPASLSTGQSAVFTVTYSPNSLGVNTATITITDDRGLRHTLGSSLSLSSSDSRAVHTVQITGNGVSDITVGDGSQTARIPLDFYYKTSLFETIYTANEMSGFIGQITGLKFYNQFSTAISASPIKIWLGSTTQTDLTAAWIPSTALTLVFDGVVDFPTGGNTINITFPTEYMHLDGGNLVMMVYRPMDTQWYSSTNYFKSQTIGTNRSREMHSDSTPYDPAAPTGGTVNGQFPQTTFVVIPGGVGHITGTVLGTGGAPLAGVQVNVNERPYSVVTDAQGQFNIANVLPNDYAVNFSHHGYVTQTINIVLEEDETEAMNVSMNLMAQVNVTGSILASDTGTGIAGANINLVGYENYSGSSIGNGSFNIPAVYANHSYAYTITAAGYTSTSGTMDIGATNHAMGNITLAEIAFAPNTVSAALNQTFNAITVSWNTPDPQAIEITEGFETDSFPPSAWSVAITNTGPINTVGVLPTWCDFGSISITGSGTVNPPEGIKQAGLWWDYTHQDEWLITPSFSCPPDAHLSFDTYATLGSINEDHYYVKVSSDAGNSWTVLWDATTQTAGENFYAYPITVNLAAYAGLEIKLAFHAEDPPSDEGMWYVWFIDNIYIGNMAENIRFAGSDLQNSKALAQDTNSGSGNTPNRLARVENQFNTIQPSPSKGINLPARSTNRALVGYKVWRLAAGQENNPAGWVSLTEDAITTLTHVDNGWTTLPNGAYKWAVKAAYTANVMSAPAFSNVIVKEVVNGTIVGFVRKQNNQGIAGATVTATGGFTATTNNAGAYSLVIPAGIYAVSANANGYHVFTYEEIIVAPNQNTTVNFVMTPTSNEDEYMPVTVTALKGNYPNPFNPETTISYDLKEAGNVRLEVYNVKGQLVRSLVNTDQASGRYRVAFNSRDDKGNPLASGIYLYRFTSGSYHSTRKMMLME